MHNKGIEPYKALKIGHKQRGLGIPHMIFIRHGESLHKVEGLIGGWTDTSLTQRGCAQVAATAKSLGTERIANAMLFCSDLKRSFESAEIIGNSLGCTPTALSELREINYGDATNLTKEEARKIRHKEPTGRNLDWRPYENAETWREMSKRMKTALSAMKFNDEQTVVVVGHAISGQALICHWLGIELSCPVAFTFDHASITELRINKWGEREIVRLNAAHYA